MADESKGSDFGSAAEVTPGFLAASVDAFNADAKNLLAQAAISSNGLKQVIANRAAAVRADHVFSHKIPVEGKATSQKSSGRCWLFAATNVIRLRMMAKYNLPADFEFSQSYLFFYDKLEKSNYFLENMIDLADADVDDRTVQRLLSDPVSDGGQWSMFQSLVNSHGLVPKSVFPECATSSASREFNAFLKNQLRGFACKLRERKAAGETLEQLRVAKNTMMATVHRMLLIHFGEPPKSFEWAYYDKDNKYHLVPDLTPQTFYRDMVPFDANEFVSLINDPRNEYQKLYTVDRLGNIVGGTPVAYINVPIDTIRKIARATIEGGKPVWFGCDVGKHLNRGNGAMDLDAYDHELAYGTKPFMTKAQRLLYHESLMTHAMVFTGFDARGDVIKKWRVENSWGPDRGDKGYLLMTDAWFDEFMYQIVVEKSELSAELLAVLEQEPVTLPAWDPMGALAVCKL